MKTSLAVPLIALMTCAAPFQAAAQHYTRAYIDIRLASPDSVRVTVEADGLDMKNALWTFPVYEPDGGGMESFRLYERRIEAYLQQKVKLRADGVPLSMKVVEWKPGGKGREDGFDTVSIRADNQSITLGGRLPAGVKVLQAWSELWAEKLNSDDFAPVMDYHLFEGNVPLRRIKSQTERWVSFPVASDSLARMRKSPLPPLQPRSPEDHSKHQH